MVHKTTQFCIHFDHYLHRLYTNEVTSVLHQACQILQYICRICCAIAQFPRRRIVTERCRCRDNKQTQPGSQI